MRWLDEEEDQMNRRDPPELLLRADEMIE